MERIIQFCWSDKKMLNLEILQLIFVTDLGSLRCNAPLFTSVDLLLISCDGICTENNPGLSERACGNDTKNALV